METKKYFLLRNYNFHIHWDWLRAQHLPGSLQNSIPQGYRHRRSFKQASQSLSAAGHTVLEQPPYYLESLFLSYAPLKRHPLDLMAGGKVMLILGVTQETKKLSTLPKGIKKLCTHQPPFSVGFYTQGSVKLRLFCGSWVLGSHLAFLPKPASTVKQGI